MIHGSSDPAGGGSFPLVFAHRGASAVRPEHTLDAYLHAIDEGVDGLECDVRLTLDGHLVCIHDRRINRTSNGRGPVSTSTLARLTEFDFGSWHAGANGDGASRAEVDPDASTAGILTLDALLGAARAAGRPLQLLVETKHPTRHAGSVERALVDLLKRHGLTGGDPHATVRVTVMSFAMLALARVRALAPRLTTAYLVDFLPPWSRTARLPFGARVFGPSVGALRARPQLVAQAHERGFAVYVWTVNSPADLELMVDLGVDGIITDRPASTLSRLNR